MVRRSGRLGPSDGSTPVMHTLCGCAGCAPLGTGNPRYPSTAWPLSETPRSSSHAVHFSRPVCRIPRKIVCNDPLRAARMHHYPEELHLAVLGKALDLYELALFKLLFAPIQLIHPLIRLLAPGIVHLKVAL